MKDHSLRLVLPSCLSPDSDLLADLSKQTRVKNKACHFLNYLNTTWGDDIRDYVPVYSPLCKQLYSAEGYLKIRPYLLERGIIESDGKYLVGSEYQKGFSKSWRITDEFNADPKAYTIYDQALHIKLMKQREKVIKQYTHFIGRMEQDLRLIGIPSDMNVEAFMEGLPTQTSNHAKACMISSIERIRDVQSEIYNTITQGEKGRYFHKLNNTSKDLRKHLTISGEPSCEVDVVNCQPLLMAMILQDKRMIQSCSEGRFYEDLMENSPKSLTRDEMKKSVLCNVIAKCPKVTSKADFEYWHGKPSDIAFKSAFPEGYSAYEEYRAKHGDLAMIHELQERESEIIHEGALPEIQKQGVNAVSIHDSFMTSENNAELVADKLREIFKSESGLSCKVKVA